VNRKVELRGVVQGVGFRPFIYQLAHRYDLKGFVQNSSVGVFLEVEGDPPAVEHFLEALQNELPPLARIDTIKSSEIPYSGCSDFEILQSQSRDDKRVPVSPDMGICDKCQQEMYDPANRRDHYPFINCTDCGPRYSIIQTVPYDRPNTSMHFFVMCEACRHEYTDPTNRRYHAQPISCPNCGPRLKAIDSDHQTVAKDNTALKLAVDAIKAGKIVALKGLGGFHLMCDATNNEAVSRLRERKRRPAKPFAVMFPDMEALKASTELSVSETALITSKEKPIVIVRKATKLSVAENVAPYIDRLGVFLPYTPLHHLLLERIGRPIVATSANLSDEPIIRNSSEISKKLGDVVDLILDHDREIVNANDDSVVQMAGDQKITLRHARGFAPKSIKLPFKSKKKILAVGANQKNSIALVFDDMLILSPHIGDLNSIEAFEYFERTVETFRRFYNFEPEVIVCDKHLNYETTKWAKQLKIDQRKSSGGKNSKFKIIEVQHHYAHLLAGMAEHQLNEKVLGFAFDGTGYGDDETIWGGEVMIADNHSYERVFTLEPFALLGGEKAVKEPRRSALALLFEHYTLDEVRSLDLPLLKQFSDNEITLLYRSWKQGVNTPRTSSMGRLFDAVASLADILHISCFEGETGLLMEQLYDRSITGIFPFYFIDSVIKLQPMLNAIIAMDEKKIIVSMFLNTVVEMIFQIAEKYPDLALLFSGGVFQNRVLVEQISRRCAKEKHTFYFQNETPINDGGIALGQVWFAYYYDTK